MFLLQTFGGLTLLHATTRAAVGAPRRKPLAVLALVAAAGERGVERDWVTSMLWPELDETRARRALSQALYALRRELGADTLGDAPRLMIDPTELVTDAGDFEALARPGRSRRDLERAASLYLGPYLDGVYFSGCTDFEQWTETARAAHARAYQGALRELARLAATAGDLPSAVQWLERAASEFPLDSDIAAALARMYADMGRQGQGHAVLNAHFAALRAELGVSPPSRLVALGQELQEPRAEAGASTATPASTPGETDREPVPSSPDRAGSSVKRLRLPRPKIARSVVPSGIRNRSRAIIATMGGLATVAAAAAYLGRPRAPRTDSLSAAFSEELSRPARFATGGRVLVHVVSLPSADPLAAYVSDVMMARLPAQATIVSRDEVLAIESRLYGEDTGKRDEPSSTDRLLQNSDASIALEVALVNVGRRDSIGMALRLSRRAMIPPCPEGWVRIGPSEADPGGVYPGIESWSSFRLSAPRSSPTRSVDSLVRAATRMLESMHSCDIEAHRGAATAPWCWVGQQRVGVVPGVIRTRISSGQDISMSMGAYGLPKGRSRFCIYSSYGRVSNDGESSTPGRSTRAP